MLKFIATTVIRGSDQQGGRGGVFIIDAEQQDVRQVMDWDTLDIEWDASSVERGFAGIAIDGETIYFAAGDRLLAYSSDFKLIDSWRNNYLRYANGLSIFERKLYVSSAGYDSVLAFELDEKRFSWGLSIDLDRFNYSGSTYDPMGEEGPLLLNKLKLNNVHANEDGLYISGARTEGMLHFNGEAVYMAVTLPEGIHDAQPFREGALFHDCEAEALRYASRSGEEDRAIKLPKYDLTRLTHKEADSSGQARQGVGRGLCALNDRLVAAGSAPSTISVFDLKESETLLSVNLSNDIRSAVSGLAVWPF